MPMTGGRPIAFAPRSMTEIECRYVQIEKEALAGPVKSSPITFWEPSSPSRQTTNLLYHYRVQLTFIISHPEYPVSNYN